VRKLCRNLCRNPPIPARLAGSRVVSLGINRGAGNSHQTRVDIAFPCYSDFFDVASSRTGVRFDTVGLDAPVIPIRKVGLSAVQRSSIESSGTCSPSNTGLLLEYHSEPAKENTHPYHPYHGRGK
jgi:hypothetical protein